MYTTADNPVSWSFIPSFEGCGLGLVSSVVCDPAYMVATGKCLPPVYDGAGNVVSSQVYDPVSGLLTITTPVYDSPGGSLVPVPASLALMGLVPAVAAVPAAAASTDSILGIPVLWLGFGLAAVLILPRLMGGK
jgi:hypothetical protein